MTFLKALKRHGKALVIRGPQGCGKTLLARQLAMGEGAAYSEATVEEVADKQSNFQQWLGGLPDVVIVEGGPNPETSHKLKQMIASAKITCNRMMKEPIEVATPTFIFCTGDLDPFNFVAEDRQFYVIDMSEPLHT